MRHFRLILEGEEFLGIWSMGFQAIQISYLLNQVILEKCRGELELAAVGTLDNANPVFAKVEDALHIFLKICT
jgi:hypothetical protein